MERQPQFRPPPAKLNRPCGAYAGKRERKAVSLFIEKQAFLVLSLAVAIGYIGARVFRR